MSEAPPTPDTLRATAWCIARNASFQAFANCYVKDVDAGVAFETRAWEARNGVALAGATREVIELRLPSGAGTLALAVRYRSRVGRHTFGETHRRTCGARDWEPIDVFSAELALVDGLYATRPDSEARLELVGRLIQSHQLIADYVASRLAAGPAASSSFGAGFIASEQSTALGHWLHPTPKSRQGMHRWQHAHYAPETGGRFRLHFFAAERHLVRQASVVATSAEQIALEIATAELSPDEALELTAFCGDEDRVLLPVHPLQAEWLMHQPHVRAMVASGSLRPLGPLGPKLTATSSVRTLYAESLDVMVKVSLPVTITNSLRITMRHELGDSVWTSKLFDACGLAQEFPTLSLIHDPAYLTVEVAGLEESGFETVFRLNPFRSTLGGSSEPTVHAIAALVQEPIAAGARSCLAELVERVAACERISLPRAGRRWFARYWDVTIDPIIALFDRHGISLEAHQQNVLLAFDDRGYPTRAYYRDIQGLGLSEDHREAIVARVPELDAQPKIFEPPEIVRDALGYYLVCNHLAAVINRLGLDGIVDEGALVDIARRRLLSLRPRLAAAGGRFVDTLLEEPTIPCKSNLMTRVVDLDELQAEDELAVYVRVPNPLWVGHDATAHAAASLRL